MLLMKYGPIPSVIIAALVRPVGLATIAKARQKWLSVERRRASGARTEKMRRDAADFAAGGSNPNG